MQPLCCVPLKPGLRLLSIIEMVVSGLLLAGSIWALVYYEEHREDAVKFLNNPPIYMDVFMSMRDVRSANILALLGFCAFYYVQKLILALLLLIATMKANKFLIRLYVLYTLALLVIHALVYFTLLCFSMMGVWSIVLYVAGFVFQEWTMWSATKYLDELVLGTADEQDDYYDFASSRRSSGNDDKYSYKL